MKKHIETVLFALIFIVSAFMLIIGCNSTEKIKKTDSTETTVGFLYTVKEFNGKVALFEYGENLPFQILESPISNLPQSEADKIRSGINVSTEKQLQNIIEAYD